MKRYIVSIIALCLTSCASVGITTPGELNLSPSQYNDTRFSANYVKLKDLHDELRVAASKFSRDSTLLNGLSATAATATLGFAGFKAHPDNTLASTIIGGVSGASATQLKPGNRARLRVKGMSALSCIASRADTFRDLTNRSNQRLNAGLASASVVGPLRNLRSGTLRNYTAGSAAGRSSYDVLDDLLYLFMAIAQDINNPSDALKTALASAQESRTKLALGIKAHNEAFDAMSNAIEAVRIHINQEQPPSIKDLVDAISKIELPKAPEPPAAGSGATGFAAFGVAGVNSDELAVLLGFLSSKVDQLTPELDASTVQGMKACVAELATGNAN